VLLALVVYWALHAVYTVQADEQGVVLRFGKYNRTTPPGLHFVMWPFETVERPKALSEFIMNFGMAGDGASQSEGLMLTGDQNIVDIEYTVLWRISDPRAYLFNVKEPEQLLRVVAESAMREYTGRNRADEIRTRGREALQAAVRDHIQQIMDGYKAGVLITSVQLNKAEPPEPVVDAFAEVNRAQQDSVKMVNQANQYAFQKNGQAKGEAAKIRQNADAYKGRVVAEAQGEAKRFLLVYDQYKNAKDVTRQRIFIETMEQVLGNSKKIVIENGAGSGVVPYLPLPSLEKGTQP
jgi:membrane protease subunit HflK